MGDRMIPGDEDFPEPRRLRQLRRLVTVLTVTLIIGVITTVALLVIRLASVSPSVTLPDEVRIPPGESARAVTMGSTWIAVVTVDGTGRERIHVLDRATGAERAVTEIAPAE
jgi:hypothetical protein